MNDQYKVSTDSNVLAYERFANIETDHLHIDNLDRLSNTSSVGHHYLIAGKGDLAWASDRGWVRSEASHKTLMNWTAAACPGSQIERGQGAVLLADAKAQVFWH